MVAEVVAAVGNGSELAALQQLQESHSAVGAVVVACMAYKASVEASVEEALLHYLHLAANHLAPADGDNSNQYQLTPEDPQ